MARANLISLFAEFARFRKDVAVVQRRGYRRESWTYAQLIDCTVSCAVLLGERGVRTGERVILWGPNSFEWMVTFWGCLLRGAVAVPLDDGATIEFASRVARETNVKLVFAASGKPEIRSGSANISPIVFDEITRGVPFVPGAQVADFTRLAD